MTQLCYRGIPYEVQSTSIHTVPTPTILKFMGVAYNYHVLLTSARKLPRKSIYRGIPTNPQTSITPQQPALPADVQPDFG